MATFGGKTVSDQYKKVADFESLLDQAQMNAGTNWEEQVFSDLATRFRQYGAGMYFSESQREQLERIANED